MLRLLLCALLLLPLGSAPLRAEPRLHLLVAENSPITQAPDRATLRRIFLGQLTWIDGVRVRPVAMPPGSPPREAFNTQVLHMSEDELASYWIEQALLGGALPPLEVENVDALCERIRRRPRTIGYALAETEDLRRHEGVRPLPLPAPAR